VGGGIKVHSTLRPLNGLLCQPRVIMIREKSVEWLAGETEVLEEKPAPVPLWPSQSPHAARTRTRAAAVGSQRLTAELRHGQSFTPYLGILTSVGWSPSIFSESLFSNFIDIFYTFSCISKFQFCLRWETLYLISWNLAVDSEIAGLFAALLNVFFSF
jgi:hypothetical protein